MSHSSDQLNALVPRLETFLGKLTARAREVAAEAAVAVAEMKASGDEDTRAAAHTLQAGVTSQIAGLANKGREVFEQQFTVFETIDDPATEAAYERLEERFEAWEDSLEAIAEEAFAAPESDHDQAIWEQAVAEWRAIRLTCSQCGAPVPVPYLYPVAVYLACRGCGSRATFTPSSTMVAATHVTARRRPDDPWVAGPAHIGN